MGFLDHLGASDFKVLDFSLRLFVIPFNVATIWIAVTNNQDNTDYGNLEFKNFIGLKYMVWMSAISAGYALFAAVSSYLIRCLFTKPWLFFVTDQVVAYAMVTSMAAVVEFLYLSYNGDQVVSWSRACDTYGRFCSRLRIALVFHLIVVCCFLVLSLISGYRVFRRFDPPFVPSKDGEHETT